MTDGRYGGEEAEEDRESKGGKQQETTLFMFISLKDGSSGRGSVMMNNLRKYRKEDRVGGRQISISRFQFFVFFCALSAIYVLGFLYTCLIG